MKRAPADHDDSPLWSHNYVEPASRLTRQRHTCWRASASYRLNVSRPSVIAASRAGSQQWPLTSLVSSLLEAPFLFLRQQIAKLRIHLLLQLVHLSQLLG